MFIDGNVLLQSGVAEQVAAVSPSVAAQLPTAQATGGLIAIPVEEYAARIAPTEAANGLLDHLKMDPNGFSRAEAQEFRAKHAEELQADMERVFTAKQGDDAFRQSFDAVKAQILQDMDAAGRFDSKKNEADAMVYASYYATRAAQMGVTPEDLYARRRVRFAAESAGGEGYDQAAKRFEGTLADLAAYMKDKPDENRWLLPLPEPTAHDAGRIAEATGIDVTGARALAYASDVRSDVRDHPDLTAEDWRQAETLIASAGRIGRSIPQHGARGERITLARVLGTGESYGGVFELHENPKHGRRLVLKTFFKGDSASVENWFVSNTRDKLGAGLTPAGGDPRFPSNPLRGQDVTFPAPDASLGENDSGHNPGGEFHQPDGSSHAPRGTFHPETLTVSLLKGADLSTALHEGAHFFFENDIALAAELVREAQTTGYDALKPGERQILADVSALLTWHGLRGDIEEQLAQWGNLSPEERRAHHERTAEAFEAYLHEGRAPSIELAPYFQKFRAWLTSVYKSLKDFLAAHQEAGKAFPTHAGMNRVGTRPGLQ